MQHEPDRRTTEKKAWKAHEDEEKRPVFGNDEQTYETKASVKNGILRLIFVAVAIIVELVWLVYVVNSLEEKYDLVNIGIRVLATVLALAIFSRFQTSNMKIPWLMLIMGFPVIGSVLYLLFGLTGSTGKMRRRYEEIDNKLLPELLQDQATFEEIERRDSSVANMTRYIYDYAKYPVYQNTDVTFYPDAAEGLEAQKEALRGAKNFIFMEYHAIEDRESFAAIRSILREKVREGVEVRVFYDDLGSIGFINGDFIKRLEADGIHCRVFNPMLPIVNIFFNNRDHRKITVVDGRVAFTGGYNLADEYFNVKHPYGHWKDTGVKITGDAVRSFTVMFLEMWNAVRLADSDYSLYTGLPAPAQSDGFVQPYADTPLDDERVGENVYLNIIKNAKKYVYITTPYLILDDEMVGELVLAAKRGVDVRIITPGIPDKKTVFKLTRSYYGQLIRGGVRIYEYTPGFVHAKQMLCDDVSAVVGTINLDYRSLYLHFENAVLFRDCPAVAALRSDFEQTFPLCCEQTADISDKRMSMPQSLLRLFAPLL